MKPLRILVLSHVHPPYNTIGAVRVGKFARHWHAMGHDVQVVTARDPAVEWIDRSLPVELPAERIHAVPFVDPNRLGMTVLRELLSLRRGAKRSAGGGKAYVGSIAALPAVLRAPAWLYTTLFNLPDRAVGWVGPALLTSLRLLRQFQPDVIFASGGPFSTLVAAALLGRHTGIPVVMDLRDLWTDNFVYTPRPGREGLERALERWTLESAALLTTTTEPWVETLRVKYHKPTHLILNGYAEEDLPEPQRQSADGPLHLVFTGRMYGALATIKPLLLALQQLPESFADLTCYLRDDPGPLAQQVAEAGLQQRVRILPPVTYQQSLQAQVNADVLALATFAEGVIYSAKLFEYVGARRPILVVSDKADNLAAALVTQRGLGLASGDPTQIAMWLRDLAAKKAAGDDLRLPDGQSADLSRVAQARQMVELLRQAARSH